MTAFTFYITSQDLETAWKHAQTITGHITNDTTTKNILESKTHHGDPPTTTSTTTTTVEIRKPIPLTTSIYRLKGIVAALFAIRPASIKLFWESDEWDPSVRAEHEEEEGGWSVSDDDDDDDSNSDNDDDDDGGERGRDKDRDKDEKGDEKEKEKEKENWKRRETELVDGTRAVGFFVEEGQREARVRVEVRC